MSTERFRDRIEADTPPPLIPLRAGPLDMHFDPTSGFLRRIRLGDREVLRGIYVAVRDHNWGTAPPDLRLTARRIEAESFRLELECRHRLAEIDFTWRGIVDGTADGSLRYEFDGVARTTFRRNRIGFCVLHPVRECAGVLALQLLTDGTQRTARFPDLIEPQIVGQSSFRQLRGIRHEVERGCWAQVEFEGDTFEMEDQRNWTDASFKTYSTPLLEPFPVTVRAGERVRQVVTLRLADAPLAGRRRTPAAGPTAVPTVRIPAAPTVVLPRIGLGVASHGESLSESEIGRLRELRLSHLRADVHAGAADASASLARAVQQAAQLDLPLELALYRSAGGSESGDWRSVLARGHCRLAHVLALRDGEPATTAETLGWARRQFAEGEVPVGAGSDCNFCELNHGHAVGTLGLARADFVFWSMNPQVHAFDHRSIMETLQAQPDIVRTARALGGDRPLVASPVTLRQRFNPVATGPENRLPPGELPAAVDARQRSQFAAAWTLGSIAALAAGNVESATYFETTGWRGVMEREGGSALPARFPSRPGEAFPLFRVLAGVAGFRRAAVVPVADMVALALFSPAGCERVLLANLTEAFRQVRIEGWGRTRTQDLSPYAVERLEAGD